MTVFANNQKARFDHEVLEKFSAGMELLGLEVKSVKEGKMNLRGSYVKVLGGEVFLVGASIPPYQGNNTPDDYDTERPRKLLLSKSEVRELAEAENTKGLTIVPLSVYNKGRFLKIDVAITRGKKKYDKRQALKKRDVEREIGRTL